MTLLVDRKRSIGQAAVEIDVHEHVLRFWESQFSDYIKPIKGNGGRRYFYDQDIKILKTIKHYLYDQGYTIKGLQNLLQREELQVDADVTKKTMPPMTEATIVSTSLRNQLKNFKVELNKFYERLKNI